MDSSDSYDTDDERSKKKQKLSKVSRVKKVSKAHLLEFEWLEIKNNEPFCKICCITLKGGKSELQRHSKTKVHQRNTQLKKEIPSVKTIFQKENDQIDQLEKSMCSFLVEHDLPISFIEPFVDFCKSLPEKQVVEKVRLGKQKATNVLRQGLRPYFNDQLVEDLKKNFFSVFIDETTDIGTVSQLAVLISYYSREDLETKVDVVDVVELNNATAEGIYSKMMEVLKTNAIPLENWVGFCCDTTSVMVGQHNSVAQLINKHHPSVVVIKCSCHLIHLVASYACKKLSNSLEDLVRTIYNHFKRSPKRTAEFKEFQQFYNPDFSPKKMLAPGQTRWLSLQECVRRILECWEPLRNYWRLMIFEDKTHANEQVLETLNNPLMKSLLEFVEYALGLFNEFNTFFQSDSPQFGLLKDKVEELLKTIALNFMNPAYINGLENGFAVDPLDSANYSALKDVYLGVCATETLFETKDADPGQVEKVRRTCRDFYIESILQIKKRFDFSYSSIFEDSVFLIPENARLLKPSTIYPLAKKYCSLKPSLGIDFQLLDAQWRAKNSIKNEADDMVGYWTKILSCKDAQGKCRFDELCKFVSLFFSLPFSNALTERLFSCLKNVKTEKRNRLDNETLSAILCIKYGSARKKMDHTFFLKNKVQLRKKVISNLTAGECRSQRLDSRPTSQQAGQVSSLPSTSKGTGN